MIDHHVAHGAGVTVAAIPVPRDEASAFGIVEVGKDGRTVEAFLEKPADPPPMPGNPDMSYASMGNYVFDTNVLVDALRKDAADDSSRHDIGGNIIPMLVANGSAQAYDFMVNKVPGAARRDVGLLARRRHPRLVLRRAHGPVRGAAGLQPVQRPAGRS